MAYAKTTYSDLQTSLAYRYGETEVPSSDVENRNYWINRGIQYCADRLNLKKSASITVASETYTMPDDFKVITRLLDSDGSEYTLMRYEDYIKAGQTGTTCALTGNYHDGFTLHVPTNGTYTLIYEYYPEDLSAGSDICPIPDGEAVVAYSYSMLRRSETDPLEDAQLNMDECNERINKMAVDSVNNEGDLSFKPFF